MAQKEGSRSVVSDSLRPHGLQPTRLLCPWDSLGKNTGVSCLFLLQGIFPTQGSNLALLHCKQIFYCMSYREVPKTQIYVCLPHKTVVLTAVSALSPWRNILKITTNEDATSIGRGCISYRKHVNVLFNASFINTVKPTSIEKGKLSENPCIFKQNAGQEVNQKC